MMEGVAKDVDDAIEVIDEVTEDQDEKNFLKREELLMDNMKPIVNITQMSEKIPIVVVTRMSKQDINRPTSIRPTAGSCQTSIAQTPQRNRFPDTTSRQENINNKDENGRERILPPPVQGLSHKLRLSKVHFNQKQKFKKHQKQHGRAPLRVTDGNTEGIKMLDFKRPKLETEPEMPDTTLRHHNRAQSLKDYYGYQCRRCFEWYTTKEDLNLHSCRNKMPLNTDDNGLTMSIYACRFCGCFEHTKDAIQPHVNRCKNFQFQAQLSNFKIYSTSTPSEGSISDIEDSITSSRIRRRKTLSTKEDSTCSQCDLVSTNILKDIAKVPNFSQCRKFILLG